MKPLSTATAPLSAFPPVQWDLLDKIWILVDVENGAVKFMRSAEAAKLTKKSPFRIFSFSSKSFNANGEQKMKLVSEGAYHHFRALSDDSQAADNLLVWKYFQVLQNPVTVHHIYIAAGGDARYSSLIKEGAGKGIRASHFNTQGAKGTFEHLMELIRAENVRRKANSSLVAAESASAPI